MDSPASLWSPHPSAFRATIWALPGPPDPVLSVASIAVQLRTLHPFPCQVVFTSPPPRQCCLQNPRSFPFPLFLPQLLNACQTCDIPFSRGHFIAGCTQTNSQNVDLPCSCCRRPL